MEVNATLMTRVTRAWRGTIKKLKKKKNKVALIKLGKKYYHHLAYMKISYFVFKMFAKFEN